MRCRRTYVLKNTPNESALNEGTFQTQILNAGDNNKEIESWKMVSALFYFTFLEIFNDFIAQYGSIVKWN